MSRNHPPEVEALLLLVQPDRAPANDLKISSLLTGDLDWELIFNLARRHSLLPLLYQRLKQAASDSVPVNELKRLRQAYEQNVGRNVVLVNELVQLTKALADEGIDCIAYKGPVLSVLAYGHPALRQFLDLDLMVRRREVMPAAEVLIKRGYVASKELTSDQLSLLLRTQHNLQFARPDGLIVELHWQVASHLFASSVTAEELWKNLETVKLNGSDLQTFAIEDLLFSLCVHGSRHLWERLAWIADIAHLLQARPVIDWTTLLERAKTAEAERMFLLGLHLAAVLLNARLPDTVKQRIDRDRRIGALATRIINTLFDGPTHRHATAREILEYNVGVRRGWRARARYLLFTLAPTDSDVKILELPATMRFGYYLLRPFRIFSKRQSKEV